MAALGSNVCLTRSRTEINFREIRFTKLDLIEKGFLLKGKPIIWIFNSLRWKMNLICYNCFWDRLSLGEL